MTLSVLEGPDFASMTNDPEGYALSADDESLAPRVRAGDVVLVAPNRAPEPGDDVYVRCHDGREMLKRLVSSSAKGLSLGSIILGDESTTIPASDVATCHRVAGNLPNARGAMASRPHQ